jgi:hypothetical protein
VIDAGSLEYAHARIWARHGQRPDEASWRRIETTRELAALLELARGSSLACWLEGVGPAADVHTIEGAVRRHWRERVTEVASWMPPAWSRAIAWCGVLVDLPVLQHLARGGATLPWMAEDPQLRGLVDGSLPGRAPLRWLLEAARADPQRVLSLWRDAWQRCLPRNGERQAVEARLAPLLISHAAAFGSPQTVDGWALRRQLQARLILLLRRTLAEPATAFIYLALSALEFERVRGELLRRAAFPQRAPTP